MPLNEGVLAAATDKWEIQLRKGSLEMAILAALWSGPRYGLEMLQGLADDSALVVPEGTVYPLLNRLRTEGLLDAEWVEAESGHPRKYYRLTAAGRQRTMRMARVWKTYARSVNRLLAPVMKEDE